MATLNPRALTRVLEPRVIGGSKTLRSASSRPFITFSDRASAGDRSSSDLGEELFQLKPAGVREDYSPPLATPEIKPVSAKVSSRCLSGRFPRSAPTRIASRARPQLRRRENRRPKLTHPA